MGSIKMQGIVIDMNEDQLKTLGNLQRFLEGPVMTDFAVASEERYVHCKNRPTLRLWAVEAIQRDHCAALSGTRQLKS